jgi:glycerol-3-phosphate acyltransferase PlsY
LLLVVAAAFYLLGGIVFGLRVTQRALGESLR